MGQLSSTAGCSSEGRKRRSPRPSLVVPSGNTATQAPPCIRLRISALMRAVSARRPRSMNSVPVLCASQPATGQARTSALETKWTRCAAKIR